MRSVPATSALLSPLGSLSAPTHLAQTRASAGDSALAGAAARLGVGGGEVGDFVAFDAALSACLVAMAEAAGASRGGAENEPAGAAGVWSVHAEDAATLTATLRHAVRRLSTREHENESRLIVVEHSQSAIFSEVATLLSLPEGHAGHDAGVLAEAIVEALGPSGVLVVGPLSGAWDEAVARALESLVHAQANRASVVGAGQNVGQNLFLRGEVVSPAAGRARAHASSPAALGTAQSMAGGGTRGTKHFVISSTLPAEAASSFWRGAVDTIARASASSSTSLTKSGEGRLSLASAEAWASLVERGVSLHSVAPEARGAALSGAQKRLVHRLSLVGRAVPVDCLDALAKGTGLVFEGTDLVGSLLLAGAVTKAARVGDDRLWLAASVPARSSEGQTQLADGEGAADARAAAGLLQRAFATDPFALSHAAELLLLAGDPAAAEVEHFRAVTMAEGLAARGDLWARWGALLPRLSENGQLGCRLRGAEFALVRGDVDVALEWAQRAAQLSPTFPALLVVGKASLGRGDLVGATVSLERALEAAKLVGPHAEAAAKAELAEVSYNRQDNERAERLSHEALAATEDTGVRLRARNTLGKLLLAAERFADAEEHFAGDESFAACAGDWTGEVRARLNRAIAVLSSGRLDEAEEMLRSVLAAATARRDEGAATRALMNLAVMAINAQRYGEALELSEQAISVGAALGERIGLAWTVTNLAVLRLRLGLVEEAEQAVLFGRRMISTGDAAGRAARLSLVRARICHARGDDLTAAREIATAQGQGPDPETMAELVEVAVRVALADGDVARAESELAKIDAAAMRPSATGCAGLAVMRAEVARARGEQQLPELVQAAITAAQRACAEEHLRDAHVLAAEVALAEDDHAALVHHLRRAAASRDRVAETLSESVRPRFLARPTVATIARLERLERAERSAGSTAGDENDGDGSLQPNSVRSAVQIPAARVSRTLAGRDPAMRALSVAIGKIARSGGTVLVQGESGTGKELVAEAIHAGSDRSAAPLVKVNCAALVESLLLSELFGHEKGAFTGASGRRRGRFEQAEGGTLFLDEIGDISPATQVALLRVLQERTYERVGGSVSLNADVRVVCATHRDLKAMVERGEFRKDLYFRLSGLQLTVPSLRSRIGDLPAIADALLTRIAEETGDPKKTLSSEALSLLARHRWPGNVRELENALRAASVFADGESLLPTDFTDYIDSFRELANPSPVQVPAATPTLTSGAFDEGDDGASGSEGDETSSGGALPAGEGDARATDLLYGHLKSGQANLFDMKRQIERDCIARALAETRGNITRAATILGMKRPRLSQLVKQYGLAEVSLEGS
jgi:transcriptional regulator with GAF, ATPase, and Fis domain/tetratricopeptide (TPR) repeat protein